jgi:hypothetical protein
MDNLLGVLLLGLALVMGVTAAGSGSAPPPVANQTYPNATFSELLLFVKLIVCLFFVFFFFFFFFFFFSCASLWLSVVDENIWLMGTSLRFVVVEHEKTTLKKQNKTKKKKQTNTKTTN